VACGLSSPAEALFSPGSPADGWIELTPFTTEFIFQQ